MKVTIMEQGKCKNVGDAYVVNNVTLLYTDNLIVIGEDGMYVACGCYNMETNTFDLVDIDNPAFFFGKDKEFSYEKLMDLVDNDNIGDYASSVAFTIEE